MLEKERQCTVAGIKSPPKGRTKRKDSDNQSADRLDVFWIMQGVSKKNTEEFSDIGKEEIVLNGDGALRFPVSRTKEYLERLMVLLTMPL